jgi:polygalacturonase
VIGAPKGGHHYLTPPHNPWDAYQDYGHSHWEDALFFGRALVNLTVRGAGTIDGGGQLASGNPQDGDGCKMFGLVSCEGVTIEGLSLQRGGWFTLLATNVTGLRVEGTNVTAQRDGFDVVGCRDVLVNNVRVEGGGDDAMVFKSDYSLGAPLHSRNLTVTNSVFGSGCNGLNFGSETVGDFSGVLWENITVTRAGKAGIGIVTMDGAHISDVTYRNISIKGACVVTTSRPFHHAYTGVH